MKLLDQVSDMFLAKVNSADEVKITLAYEVKITENKGFFEKLVIFPASSYNVYGETMIFSPKRMNGVIMSGKIIENHGRYDRFLWFRKKQSRLAVLGTNRFCI